MVYFLLEQSQNNSISWSEHSELDLNLGHFITNSFKLDAIYEGNKFTAEVYVDKNKFSVPNLKFSPSEKPDQIVFTFKDAKDSTIDIEQTADKLSEHACSIMESNHVKNMSFSLNSPSQEITIKSEISNTSIGNFPAKRINLSKSLNGDLREYSLLRIPLDVSNLKDEMVDSYPTIKFHEWLVNRFETRSENLPNTLDYEMFYDKKHFSALLFENRQNNKFPIFSFQQTVVDEKICESRIRLDGRFELTNDRKKFRRRERDETNRTSWAVGEANMSMITEMAIQYSDSLYQQAELISEPNKKDFLFLDVSHYIEEI